MSVVIEVTVINPIEHADLIRQAVAEFKDCMGDNITTPIKLQCAQIEKSLAKIKTELKKLGC